MAHFSQSQFPQPFRYGHHRQEVCPCTTRDVTGAVKPGENKLQVLVTSTSNGKPKLGDAVVLKAVPVRTVE